MFNVHGWKAVARDALFIYILTFVLGFLLNAFLGTPIPPSSLDGLIRTGLWFLIGIIAFGVIGILTKEKMWKHLFRISIVLLIFSTIRNFIQFSMQMPTLNGVMLFSTIWIPFVQYSIALTLGGTIASIIRVIRRQFGAAS